MSVFPFLLYALFSFQSVYNTFRIKFRGFGNCVSMIEIFFRAACDVFKNEVLEHLVDSVG